MLPRRAIPSTGEPLPLLGLGTWQVLDLPPDRQRERAPVVRGLFAAGGTLLDSSPMYGRAEECAGALLRELALIYLRESSRRAQICPVAHGRSSLAKVVVTLGK